MYALPTCPLSPSVAGNCKGAKEQKATQDNYAVPCDVGENIGTTQKKSQAQRSVQLQNVSGDPKMTFFPRFIFFQTTTH